VGLRETLNENPKLVTGVTVGLIVIILGWIIISSFGGSAPGRGASAGAAKAYFSDDDGKTYFADDARKVAPFDHNGKQAVKANVYRCNGKEFVNHLERYTPEMRKKAEEAMAGDRSVKDPTIMATVQQQGLEVKRPGDKDWTKLSAGQKAMAIITPQCPGGGNPETLEVVYP
jgi:hypothetical protein